MTKEAAFVISDPGNEGIGEGLLTEACTLEVARPNIRDEALACVLRGTCGTALAGGGDDCFADGRAAEVHAGERRAKGIASRRGRSGWRRR